MSLETQLQANTAAIVELTKAINLLVASMTSSPRQESVTVVESVKVEAAKLIETSPSPEPTPEPAPVSEPTPEPVAQQMSKDDLQSWAILQVRDEKLTKKHLLAVLAEHEAKTISGLKDEQVMSVYAKLGGK